MGSIRLRLKLKKVLFLVSAKNNRYRRFVVIFFFNNINYFALPKSVYDHAAIDNFQTFYVFVFQKLFFIIL